MNQTQPTDTTPVAELIKLWNADAVNTITMTPVQRTTLEMVAEFHNTFNKDPDATTPHITDSALNLLRVNLLNEELTELTEALNEGDTIEVLDALTDLQYVLDGAYLAFGFADVKTAAFNEVHRSNMSKLGADGKPIYREDGKILKGPNYSEPNLAQFVSND